HLPHSPISPLSPYTTLFRSFLDPFECPGKCLLVFKVEWRECNVRAKLFSRFGLIAHPRTHSYALFGKSLCYIAPDRAGRACYQDRFTHKVLLYSVMRSRKCMERGRE